MADDVTRTEPPAEKSTRTQPPAVSVTKPPVDGADFTRTTPPDADGTRSFQPAPAVDPMLPIIPGYTLHRAIEAGGMGIVYIGTQLRLNRPVAVKMVLGGAAAKRNDLLRFLVEAEAVAAIDHPNVVRVLESGDANGRPYLAMEYLPGGTLAAKLKDGPLPARDAADLVRKLALAVQAAHDRQIVHRDLKPSNVLFDATGEPKVTDFGLAKRSGGGDLTATLAIMGTPAYMAPEQARGESKFVGPPADVWALGVILYECLSGRRPFESDDHLGLLHKVVSEEPSSVRSGSTAVPRDLELIVHKCLAKDPVERYSSAAALADDLRRFRAGEPVSVKPAGTMERLRKWVKRHPRDAALVSGAAFALLLATAVSIGFAIAAKQAENRADLKAHELELKSGELQVVQANVESGRKQVVEQQVIARQLMDMSSIVRAGMAFDNKDVGYANELMDDVALENRTSLWKIVRGTFDESAFVSFGHTNTVTSVAFSPDGRTLATGSDDNTVRLWDAATGTPGRVLKGHTNGVTSVAFSPDGRTLATGSWDNTVRLWDAATGTQQDSQLISGASPVAPRRELKGHTDGVMSVAFSPDGRTLATGSWDKTVRLWDAATGTPGRELKGHTDGVTSVAFSPDGRTLATGSGDNTVRLWDAATGTQQDSQLISGASPVAPRRELKGHTDGVTSVAFSPDGRTLATGSWDKTVRLWDAANGTQQDSQLISGASPVAPRRELKGHTDGVTSVAFSPDGRTLATGSWDKTVRLWDAATGTQQDSQLISGASPVAPRRELKGHTDGVTSVAFSPDGRTLATGSWDKTVRLWDAATGTPRRELKGHTNSVTSVAFSPDGRTLATGSWDKTVRLWDAATGTPRRELKGHTNSVTSVAFSPDGRTLATGSYDNTVRLWDAATGTPGRELKGHTGMVTSVAFSPDGRTLATGSDDNTVRLWDAATGTLGRELKGHTDGVTSVAFSPDGRTLATGSDDNTVRLWDAATGTPGRELKGHTRSVTSVAFSPDGRTLATGSRDKTVRLWDVATGTPGRELKGHTGMVTSVAFSPDGRTLATDSDDNTVRLWDAATGTPGRELKGHTNSVTSVAFSPDGRTLATGSYDNTVRLWDAATGTPGRELKGHTRSVTSVAFSPDGRTLATGSDDNTVRLWDAATGTQQDSQLISGTSPVAPRRELKGHTNSVTSVAFSPDGSKIVSRDSGNAAVVWDAKTGEILKDAPIPESTATSFDDGNFYIPDGKVIRIIPKAVPPAEIERRKHLMRPRPDWHREQAESAARTADWFAAAFQLRRLILLADPDPALSELLAMVQERLPQAKELAPLPRAGERP